MKKKVIKLDRALSLDKETIAQLSEEQLSTLEGGVIQSLTCRGGDDAEAPTQFDGLIDSCSACSCNN
jgi:hypothetical protein